MSHLLLEIYSINIILSLALSYIRGMRYRYEGRDGVWILSIIPILGFIIILASIIQLEAMYRHNRWDPDSIIPKF